MLTPSSHQRISLPSSFFPSSFRPKIYAFRNDGFHVWKPPTLLYFMSSSSGLWHRVVGDWWRQHGPLERWYPTSLHGVTTQKTSDLSPNCIFVAFLFLNHVTLRTATKKKSLYVRLHLNCLQADTVSRSPFSISVIS